MALGAGDRLGPYEISWRRSEPEGWAKFTEPGIRAWIASSQSN
jgi:hypothetical protein